MHSACVCVCVYVQSFCVKMNLSIEKGRSHATFDFFLYWRTAHEIHKMPCHVQSPIFFRLMDFEWFVTSNSQSFNRIYISSSSNMWNIFIIFVKNQVEGLRKKMIISLRKEKVLESFIDYLRLWKYFWKIRGDFNYE